jgi:hypothetical protein
VITVTAKWAPRVATNHTPLYRFEVWKTGTRLIADLKVAGGSIGKDASAWPRTTAALSVADTAPHVAQLCTPFGARVRIYRGVGYPDNTTELLLLGDLDIVKSRFARPDGTLELDLADPAAAVAGDVLPGPLPKGNILVGDLIQSILANTAYYGSHTLTSTAPYADLIRTPADYVLDGDKWDAIEQLADSVSAECWFTPARAPLLRPEPVLKATADAALYALDGGTVTAISSELVRAPNAVYLYGGPDVAGKQIRGVAWDGAASSPTWVGGPYGRVGLVAQRPAPFGTLAQANTAATNMLSRVQRAVRTVELECVPNPALEPGDTVELRFAGGAKEKHLITAVEIPLGGDDHMRVRCASTAYTTTGWP